MDETVVGYHPPNGFLKVTDYEETSDGHWSIDGKEVDGLSSELESMLVNYHASNAPSQNSLLLVEFNDGRNEIAFVE